MKLSRRITALVISALLVFSTVICAAGSEQIDTVASYTSDDGNYVANKISHPNHDVRTNDGIVDYAGDSRVTDEISDDTKGDRCQNYSWSALGYGDWIYVGTCPNSMISTVNFMKSVLGHDFDEATMKSAANVLYNGAFYYGEDDGGDPKGILAKINSKTGQTKLLMSKATTNTNVQFRNAVEYKGMFYFCGSVNGLPSVYQVDPKTDEYKLVYQSISPADYFKAYTEGICVGIRGICEHNGKLVISLVGLEGAYICQSDDPSNPDSFEKIADMSDMFNYPAYHYSDSIYGGSVWDMVSYNGSLYVVLCTGTPDNKPDSNSMQSFAIIRGDQNADNKWTWSAVAGDKDSDGARYTFGIDPERTRSGAANLFVYDDYLYIGEYNDEEIAMEDILFNRNCNFVNANLEQSVNLYRMDKNEDIELVVGDADEMFPDGSLTGYGSGFGKNENQYIWRMQEYNGKLYIGTFDTSSLLEPFGQFANGDILNMTAEEWKTQIDYICELIDRLTSAKGDTPAVEDAQELTENLDDMTDDIDEEMSCSFIEKYKKLLDDFNDIKSLIPADIVGQIKKLLTKENLDNLMTFARCMDYLAKADRGFDLYVIDSNMNVDVVTTNGFGDPYNHGLRVFAINDFGLSCGTANPFYGTQIWTIKCKSDEPSRLKYDVNGDGIEDVTDATFVQMVLAKIIDRPDNFDEVGDVNDDGIVNITDATTIQMYLAKMI